MTQRLLPILCLLCGLTLSGPALGLIGPVKIGVLSHRGDKITVETWSPTAKYLSSAISDYRFEIVPLDFDDVNPAVERGEVDFVLVNPGIYVNLEVRYRVSRIATLNNRLGNIPYNIFGGVIFTRDDRKDLTELSDLNGKTLMAVDAISLGGFQMAWREMNVEGIDPYQDLAGLSFGGIHDQVVLAVRDGRVDAGTVRTNILERMALEGSIDLEEFRIINDKSDPAFPLSHSTRLYPEWPFSKVKHTSNKLAQRVAVALLNMPENHPAAVAGKNSGWTIPLDYQPVHELLHELRLPPYQDVGKFTLLDAIKQYWYWLLMSLLALFFMVGMTAWVLRLNRELEKAKLKLEKQRELVLNSVADGIYGVDLHGNTTFVNRAMEKITGWQAAEMIGRNQHEILHHTRADGSPHPAHQCPVFLTFRDNQPRFVEDDVFWKSDGTSIPVEYSSTPIRDEQGDVVGSMVVFRDISARKQAEEEARQHQMELAHVARLNTMGEMASGIAHEINQPLTAIATNSQACIRLLESGPLDRERCADIMERIAVQAEHAGEIIRQLRQFIRKEQPQRSPIHLNRIIRDVAVLFAPEARKAGVVLRLELENPRDKVLGQPIQIEQVILNLARNAIEAMVETPPQQRRMTIRVARGPKDTVEVSVQDTGPGLSEHLVSTLFNPFVTTKPQGMGLGLSISLGIIEAHQGNLFVDSRPDKGARFRFTLPVYHGDRND